MISIDVVDMNGANKGKFEQIKKNIIGKEILSYELLSHYCSANPKDLMIFKVAGDAMSPTINSGDFVWVDFCIYMHIIQAGLMACKNKNAPLKLKKW